MLKIDTPPARQRARRVRPLLAVSLAFVLPAALSGCGSSSGGSTIGATHTASGAIVAVGAENEYADVLKQIGGPYVKVSAIMSNPNTDPHTFETTASVGETVRAAKLIVQNGASYDDFMTKIENAAPSSDRKVINVQQLLGLRDDVANPHLWYSPKTMPAVAKQITDDLSALEPSHAAYFASSEAHFLASLKPWFAAIAAFRKAYPNAAVATTEPVADYMLEAAGTDNKTPFTLQAAIMNGTDPAPQDVTLQNSLFTGHKVKVFVYNQQVTDTLTDHFKALAKANGIPVVGVYETMPTPGYNYQSWMVAEVAALRKAVADKVSTESLIH